ncbi:MAG: hypothetical protein MZU95_05240 [Desulfomicrobium escambiense]|nr:hypothetical protein [Desulfomicrobium escambiense]
MHFREGPSRLQRNLPGHQCRDGQDPGQELHLHQPGERHGRGGHPGGKDAGHHPHHMVEVHLLKKR